MPKKAEKTKVSSTPESANLGVTYSPSDAHKPIRRVIRLLPNGTAVSATGNPNRFKRIEGMLPIGKMGLITCKKRANAVKRSYMYIPFSKHGKKVDGDYCEVDAENSTVSGSRCIVNGNNSVVNGDYCDVYGNFCVVRGQCCRIWGNNCTVYGERCIIRGVVSEMYAQEYELDGGTIIKDMSTGDTSVGENSSSITPFKSLLARPAE